ncbi:MAG: sortase [Clostridia bacterium]|nr:sortase [Clostridia bacterium]
MKIIYEDGSDRNEGENIGSGSFEFEDVSSDSARSPGAKKPVRPVRRPAPTLRPKPEGQPSQPQATAQPVYNQPYAQGYVPVPGYMPQGYVLTPEQAAAYQQQYPQGYPVYQGMPQGYIPPQYIPYQPQPPIYTQPPAQHDENNPGTRVLYQSPDFDHQERTAGKEAPFYPQPTYSQPVIQTGIAHEDVDYSDESVPSRPRVSSTKKASPSYPSRNTKSFGETDVEMSVFELNSMAQKKQPTVKPVRQPGMKKQGLDVEDFEQEIDEEFEDFADDSLDPIPGEKKKLPVSEIIRRVVLAISLVAIVVAAGMLINEWRLSKENKALENEISDLIIDVTEPSTTKKPSKDKDTEKTTKPAETTTAALTPAQQWAQIKAEYPDVIFPVNLQLKYAKLYATNQDFVGYLSADGINLNLPIVQTDNDEDYMNKNFYGKSTKYGCPFVTHLNNITELDMNTVIFGHHMNDGTVFGALDEYKSIEGFKAAPVITFNTIYKDYQWKVIAAFITNAYGKDDNDDYIFRYYFTSLSTQERFSAFLNELSQRSLYDTGVDVLPTDKILTLSTCSHEFIDARFVVVARLVRNGETAEVDVSKAVENPSPRYPQAYYDKKGLDNPYKDASKWEVG